MKKFIPYRVVLSIGKSVEFNGQYRRDLETNHWHYYEKDDGLIIHFRKEHMVYVDGDTAETVKASQATK